VTGVEAIRAVATMPVTEARRVMASSPDATLRLVAGWLVDEPQAFDEIAQLRGITRCTPVVRAPEGDRGLATRVVQAFADWTSMRAVAVQFGRTPYWVSQTLTKALGAQKCRHLRKQTRNTLERGVEFRVVDVTASDVVTV
jgi:hypothetical protein